MDELTLHQIERAIGENGTGNAEVVRDLEAAFADLTGARYALAVSSYTTALISALWAVGVRPGHTVAVSALGPAMTGLAVAGIGATPVFLDCASPTSFGVDPEAAAKAASAGISAAVLVPMWGYWDERSAALTALRDTRIPIVVDAAQAPFLRLRGDGLFALADVVCLSLHGRKPFKAGEGGIALTAQQPLAERMLAIRSIGQAATITDTRIDPVGPFAAGFGVNFKINALGAGWCLAQLHDADQIRARLSRQRDAALTAFAATGARWTEAAQGDQVQEHGRYGVVALCPTAADAVAMAARLQGAGVDLDTIRYQYAPMYTAAHFASYATACPRAEHLAATAVACRLEAFPGHTRTRRMAP